MLQAAENNQKLFRRYAKMFALSDPHIYTSHADKLSLWLNDSKAYYATARPEIVKLLLIAQMTLRRALGLAEHLNSPLNISEYSEYPMAKSYIKLVKTVEPFQSHFPEPGLLAHLRSLLASVSPPHEHGGTQKSIAHPQSNIQTHSHDSETLLLPSHVSETQITEPTSSTMTPSAPNILPFPANAQVKAKKRKAVDFGLLVQRDIKALLEKQGNQGHSSQHVTEDHPMVSSNSLEDPLPSAKPSPVVEYISVQPICDDQKMATSDQMTQSLPSQDTSAATQAQGNSPPVCEDQRMTALDHMTESLPSQDTSPVTETQEVHPPVCVAAPDQITQPLQSQDTSEVAESQGTSQAVTEDREMVPPDPIGESSTLQKAIELKNYASQSVTEDQEMEDAGTADAPPLSSEDADAATEPQGSSLQPVTEEQERQKIAAGDSEDPGPLPSQNTSAAIETQESLAMVIDKENVTVSLQPSQQIRTRNLTPPVSSDRLANIFSPVHEVRPLIPPASAGNLVKGSPLSAMPRKFGQEMRIVAVGKGLSKGCTMTFTCTVSNSLFPKVSAWLNRNIFSLNIEQSLCLSLGCYSIADLQEQSTKNKCTTLEQQTSVARSYWPQRGGLSMNVQFKNGREELPLSPPFQLTPDGLVDVSQFVSAGTNAIKLNQTTDMSQYIFVLHSHHPTSAQLREVDRRRQRDKEWQEWVLHVSRPFDITLSPILQT
ncbi:hypothetical protein BYT27DRAFT_7195459 [Phlegmacium glaucopus]|nr:hypothetical protein BYT27DRAFT_7195459 [Phlegmacium glaucopus]